MRIKVPPSRACPISLTPESWGASLGPFQRPWEVPCRRLSVGQAPNRERRARPRLFLPGPAVCYSPWRTTRAPWGWQQQSQPAARSGWECRLYSGTCEGGLTARFLKRAKERIERETRPVAEWQLIWTTKNLQPKRQGKQCPGCRSNYWNSLWSWEEKCPVWDRRHPSVCHLTRNEDCKVTATSRYPVWGCSIYTKFSRGVNWG